MTLEQWVAKHGISAAALADLRQVWATDLNDAPALDGMSESAVTSRCRLEESRLGTRLWRNNNGAYQDESGRWIRYGLANDSKRASELMKSSDWIGCRPEVVTQDMVGRIVGRFVAREIKAGDWRYKAQPREAAQLTFINLINSLGGDACFWNGARYEQQ